MEASNGRQEVVVLILCSVRFTGKARVQFGKYLISLPDVKVMVIQPAV